MISRNPHTNLKVCVRPSPTQPTSCQAVSSVSSKSTVTDAYQIRPFSSTIDKVLEKSKSDRYQKTISASQIAISRDLLDIPTILSTQLTKPLQKPARSHYLISCIHTDILTIKMTPKRSPNTLPKTRQCAISTREIASVTKVCATHTFSMTASTIHTQKTARSHDKIPPNYTPPTDPPKPSFTPTHNLKVVH